MSRSLVLTANYAAGALELPSPFLRSLRATGCDSDVILIANHGSPEDEKHLTDIMPSARLWVPISKQRYRFFRRLANTFPDLAAAYARRLRSTWRSTPSRRPDIEFRAAYLLNITCSRYFLARHFLLEHPGVYDRVMLADSRDVLFQRDPFAELPEGITTGLERILVRDQPANLQWLQHLYGDDPTFPMDDILPQNVICSGVTLGDVTSVGKYLELICAEFMEKLPRMIHTPYLDQGAHNGLIRTGRVPSVHLTSNGEDRIATIGTSDLTEFTLTTSGSLLAGNGRRVSIVHQYDRHKGLTKKLLEDALGEP
jgi:hypothetical protein